MVYLGIIVLVMLGLGGLVMAGNKAMALPLVAIVVLYVFSVYIWVLIVAFKEGVGHGIGCLFCWLYSLYFVYKEDTSPALKAYYSVSILIGLGLRLIGAAMKD